jgi:hypothetical protein
MNPSREVLPSASRYPGQISWDYDRAEIIADGAVHAIGVCLGFIGAVTIIVIAVRMERIEVTPILIYVIGLVTMLALSAAYNMWPISPGQVDSAALRPLRDLFIDRRNLHTVPGADEKRSGFDRSWRRRVVERRHRHRSEARTSRAVRSPGHRSLPAAGLERCHRLRLACIRPPEREPMASRNRRHSLFSRRALSCLAGPAFSQRDLACFCAARSELPLLGGPRLLAMGISGS